MLIEPLSATEILRGGNEAGGSTVAFPENIETLKRLIDMGLCELDGHSEAYYYRYVTTPKGVLYLKLGVFDD